jgi:limonene-1,2-epoxide hydrolase
MNRLERLVRRFLAMKFDGPAGLWRLQIRLLDLQTEIQGSIAVAKRAARTDVVAREGLEGLRGARREARRFGDAFAWAILGASRRIIYPLAQNSRVAISRKDDHAIGVRSFVSAVANEGWGFPLIHDVTDVLRIGDVTFVRPGDPPLTLELKTKVVQAHPERGGKRTEFEFEVQALGVREPPPIRAGSSTEPASTDGWRRRRPLAERVNRQVQRLQTAEAHQTAEPGVSEIDGKPVVTILMNDRQKGTESDRIDVLRSVTRRARRNGFAAQQVDETFLWAAVYDKDGLEQERFTSHIEQLPGVLVNSGIFFSERTERNAIVIYSLPPKEARSPSLYTPYHLLGLPVSTTVDIMRGRMVVFNIVNPGRLIAALEAAGFEVSTPGGLLDLSNESLVLSYTIDTDHGAYRAEIHALGLHITEMMYEFRSVSYLVDMAVAMREEMPKPDLPS